MREVLAKFRIVWQDKNWGGNMFSLFKKKPLQPACFTLTIMTAKELGIYPENIRTDVVGHDFCFDWLAAEAAAIKQNCNLDEYLCAPLVQRLLDKPHKSPITFWYAPLGKLFVVTVYSSRKVDFFDPLHGMRGYVEYGGNYLRPTARPFLHWDGKNVFRVHAISVQPSGSFLLADFGNGFGLDVSETDEEMYNDIRNNSAKHFGYSAVPQRQPPITSTISDPTQHVLCVSVWG